MKYNTIRNFSFTEYGSSRKIVFQTGSVVCGGKVTINKIEESKDRIGNTVTNVYVKNDDNSSCLWKEITVTNNNVAVVEYDWKEIIS
jgi:hypothetical protein